MLVLILVNVFLVVFLLCDLIKNLLLWIKLNCEFKILRKLFELVIVVLGILISFLLDKLLSVFVCWLVGKVLIIFISGFVLVFVLFRSWRFFSICVICNWLFVNLVICVKFMNCDMNWMRRRLLLGVVLVIKLNFVGMFWMKRGFFKVMIGVDVIMNCCWFCKVFWLVKFKVSVIFGLICIVVVVIIVLVRFWVGLMLIWRIDFVLNRKLFVDNMLILCMFGVMILFVFMMVELVMILWLFKWVFIGIMMFLFSGLLR